MAVLFMFVYICLFFGIMKLLLKNKKINQFFNKLFEKIFWED